MEENKKMSIKGKMSKPKVGEIFYQVEFFIDKGWFVVAKKWKDFNVQQDVFNLGNCFLDEELANQVAMDMNLKAKLRQFTYENGWKDEYILNGRFEKYMIYYDVYSNKWIIPSCLFYISLNEIFFINKEVTERAIEEIVKPFCEANPTYRFQEGE